MSVFTNTRTYISPELDGADNGTETVETTVTESGADRRFMTLLVSIVMTDTDNVLLPAIISIGTNSPNYNNIVSAKPVGSLIGAILGFALAADLAQIPEGTVIKCKKNAVATALLGSPTCKFKVALHGLDQLYED